MVLVRPSDYFYAYDAIRQESFQGQSVLVFASVADVDAVCAYKVLSVRLVERNRRRCWKIDRGKKRRSRMRNESERERIDAHFCFGRNCARREPKRTKHVSGGN